MSATIPAERMATSSSGSRPRAAYLGSAQWLEVTAPPAAHGRVLHLTLSAGARALATDQLSRLTAFSPDVVVVLDPLAFDRDVLVGLPGLTLGVLCDAVDRTVDDQLATVLGAFDRLLTFRPVLSGATAGKSAVWRAIPPPIADRWYADVPELHHRPLAMTLGRSTPHREAMLLPAKHHHDLLQAVHGIHGEALAELLREYAVAVYVPPLDGGGFGAQVGIHLAAGQMLFAESLIPRHGLEEGLDYVGFRTPDELVHRLDRLARFPEMHQRMRMRGRLKAEGFRASRVFLRLLDDLTQDVRAFGSPRN